MTQAAQTRIFGRSGHNHRTWPTGFRALAAGKSSKSLLCWYKGFCEDVGGIEPVRALTVLELFAGLASPLHCLPAIARGDNMTLPTPPETPDPMIDDPALPDTTPERDPPPTMPPVIPTPVGDPPADEPPAVL
jgi:hypothetical protein